jgi:MYXO-CTERM domain-containing protein
MRSLLPIRAALVLSSFAAGALFASTSAAHISLERGSTHKSRYGDTFIKEGPCGKAGGTRGENVYTYKEGETVQVEIVEFIPHPGYFRIAFDDDGDDDFVTPASIDPVDPNRACPYGMPGMEGLDKCGESDFYNNETVLPDMDNLNPHIMAMAGTKYTFDVKMPKVECDNCTLQILQVMEDTIHGAYNPDNEANSGLPDVYFTCIDLVLEHDPALDEEEPPASSGDTKDSSGCSVSTAPSPAGTPVAVGALVLGALALRRRRNRPYV